MPHYLLHLSGELSLKGKELRKRFTDRLVHNLADALRTHGLDYRIERRWSRIVVESESPEAASVAGRIFGVKAVAVAVRRPWSTFDDLIEHGEEIFAPQVAGRSFAVRVRRGEEASRIPFRSPQLERALGARLLAHAREVSLGAPEIEARIELQGDRAFFFGDLRPAEGGLPVGTGGRGLVLFSGGFDSPVAAWQMLRRGVRLDFLFCNLGGEAHLRDVLAALAPLA
ncbi:MAG: THUMP domain-containing protein, partial [Holophagales bacterium]|nr:THUMP domain-containing protein [Holophagales bacterium]